MSPSDLKGQSSTLDVQSSSPPPFATRLIPLPDGRPGLRGGIPVDVTTPSEIRDNSCNSCLDFVSSDATLDRYNEIIIPSGWNLTTYQRNPVFQNAHQYGDIIFTLGKALITEVRQVGRDTSCAPSGPVLFQRIQFAVDANPVARIAYALYAGKFLNTVSVGFIPTRWLDADGTEYTTQHGTRIASSLSSPGGEGQGEEAPPRSNAPTLQRSNGPSSFTRKYLEQELLEVSAVAIPANPNALALAYKSGALERSDLRETADLLRQLAAAPVPSPRGEGQGSSRHSVLASADEGEFSSPPLHQSTNPSIHSLLPLARQLRDLLR